MNTVEAALIGGLLGAVLASCFNLVLGWSQRRQQRAHDLRMSALAHRHELQRAVLEDVARLRDARLARLREDAKELTRALFDLERLALLIQWGESADRDEMKRVELAARARFESARAGLMLDPDGARLTSAFAALTREIEQYQSMLQSHRVLVEARVVDQVVEHADQMEAKRRKVIDGITAAIQQMQALLASVAVPVEAESTQPKAARMPAPQTGIETPAVLGQDAAADPDLHPTAPLGEVARST